MNDHVLAQPRALSGGFHRSTAKEAQKVCEVCTGGPLLSVLHPLTLCRLPWKHLFVLHLHVARPHQRALCFEPPTQDGSLKTLCFSSPGESSSMPQRQQAPTSRMLLPWSLATAPTPLLTLLTSLATRAPHPSTPLTPPCLFTAFPVNSQNPTEGDPRDSASWSTD